MSFVPPEVSEDVPQTPADAEGEEETEAARRSTRRTFIFMGALAAASTLAPRAAQAQQGVRKVRGNIPAAPDDIYPTLVPLAAVSPPPSWANPAVRLVRRATYGLTAAEVARAKSMGYQGWLNRQINYTRINDSMVNTFVGTTYPLLSQTPEQLKSQDAGIMLNQLRESTIYRAAFSERQLYERMVEFWSDHFNIYWDKVGYLKIIDDRDVIRKHAMGRFSDLVMASAKSPAMLNYLDQNLSRVNRTNENYARELMELHTLGVDGGYSQTDVSELARVLTGWTTDGNGRFRFDAGGHDYTAKTVLGVSVPATSSQIGAEGIKEGEQIINMLVQHPNTATFIATKLLKWLLTPEPTANQINTVTSVFKSTNGDIRLTVRAVLNSGWLAASHVKLKRPFHLLVSGLRASNPTVSAMNTMRAQVDAMGHSTFFWETPDGYPDKVEYWAGNILPRWNFATSLSTANNATLAIDMNPYIGTPTTVVDAINQNYFGSEMAASLRSSLITYLAGGTFNATRIRETIALAMSSSGFQWY